MSFHRLPLTACALLLMGMPVHAEITITQSEYAAGVLVVRGETSQPNQRVTLDGRFDTRTDSVSQFVFRVRYLPPDCTADIRAGRETHPVVITNCNATEAVAPTSPTSPGAGATANVAPRAGDDAPRTELLVVRPIRQPCEIDKDCMVVCPERAYAVNAFCPGGAARLIGERSVACPAGRGHIVAYCAVPANERLQGAKR
ncbi:hypothetical protein RA307_13010 [Xanthobacteraceae bacterium Astr-EGSB]|uniref:hypothetical protein n=1 Tax=Astrobacterium formosum TaxID=3069710 RepID=UPI0027AEF9A7|nr:hypothetical protein [Xanthobacteraceae bacterium Astr-EGSB]